MVDRLTNLIGIFQKPELDFSQNRAEHDDILGDAYEYLMRHFATESGKSKGQFYTPSEVSRVIAKVIGISPQNTKAATTAYDPTCGSGSLLLKVAAEAGKHITLEGQEKDVTTAGLARMNMILHDFPTANILSGNTLAAPKFKDGEQLRTYDYVVANPPFSDKTWSTGLTPENDPFQRFAWGVPPAKQGDYAYLLHIIRSMKSTGKAACILPHGVLFRGNAEAVIRQQLVRSGIPQGHHRPAGQPLLRHRHPRLHPGARQGERRRPQGRVHDRRLQGLHQGRQQEPPARAGHPPHRRHLHQAGRRAALRPHGAAGRDRRPEERLQPQPAALHRQHRARGPAGHRRPPARRHPGARPRCAGDYWQVLPGVRAALFEPLRPGYARLKLPLPEVKSAILGHPEFTAFNQTVTQRFADWRAATTSSSPASARTATPRR
jgi:type I restriction enzyme M protein